MIKIKLLNNKVLIKLLEQKNDGAIFIPDVAQQQSNTGAVVAAGPGARNKNGVFVPITVKVGDEVLYQEFGAQEIEVDGAKYFLMSEDNVVAIVNSVEAPGYHGQTFVEQSHL